ncbi:MAG: membrane dipeptidase [Nannocystaceae bacterium]
MSTSSPRLPSLAVLGALTLAFACSGTGSGSASDSATSGETESDGETDTDGEAPLEGVADLHLHMFAEQAFGGGWLHGHAEGPAEIALAPCDGGDPGDHGRLREDLVPLLGSCDLSLEELGALVPLIAVITTGGGAAVGEVVGQIPGTDGDTGKHDDRTQGWPELTGWPRWDVIAHQQAWEDQLLAAYEAGLRLEVISAVSNDWLCRALPPENVIRPECDEMADVRVQLEMANAFAESHEWAEIALTAADARRIIEDDRLALILSVEASHLLNAGDWQAGLDELHGLGVRTLQPVHQLNNRFGGAALHNTIFHVAQYAESCHIDMDCGRTTETVTLGFDLDANCKNTLGLTDEGKALTQAMMERGMLVDVAHLSEAGVRDVFELAVARDYYPFYISHGHFREIMTPERQKEEKTTPSWVITMLRETGGIFGVRTAPDEVNTYSASPVENSCHGSSRSFAQAYDFGRLGLKVAMALGSDLNGFIQQTRPRFGADACTASFAAEGVCQRVDEAESGPPPLGSAFDEIGFGHIGVLLDLVDDLDALGTDTAPLRGSADAFVRMWERAEGERSGPAESADDLDVGGIEVLPAHSIRQAEYPSECGVRYCPSSLAAGETCRYDGECVSGSCGGAGMCGQPRGVCG